ncbi:hypothetical protein ES705_20062 [subsurface metagenome]
MRSIAIQKFSLMLIIFAFGAYLNPNFSQEVSKTELEARAFQYFKSHNYDKAATDFEVLYDLFPKDSRFAYYLGRSYLLSNQKLDDAVRHLKFAATRNYGEDAYYYLGRAYHLTYTFEDATLAFITFKKTARNSDLNKLKIDYWINVNENAKESVKVARKIVVDREQSVPENALESAFGEELHGNFIYVPDEFKSKTDIEEDYQALMFLPDDVQLGDYIYFESLSKKAKQELEIYRVEVLSSEDFSMPEPLPLTINTEHDEAYPYYDKSSSLLYFSSKGHNTSGGYDIFRCRYDSANSAWTSPEKLDFPINTTYDDILYTMIDDGKKSIFLSNRNSMIKEYIAYTILNNQQTEYLTPANREDILALALFDYEDRSDNIRLTYYDYEENFDGNTEYEQLLTEALALQLQSDSLAWIVTDLRKKIENEDNYQKKQVLIANITTIDKESKRMQLLADEKFLLAEQIGGTNDSDKQNDYNSAIHAENKIEGLTVYSFNSSSTQAEESSDLSSEVSYNKGKEAAAIAKSEFSTGFSIQQTSPYSEGNPIPVTAVRGGLMYKIQLGAFSLAIPENSFGGLTPVSKEREEGNTKYYVGSFTSLKEVRKALEQVKEYGYPDAFIVSYYNNEKISIQQAKEIEFARK